jgi:hypothetical protein
LFFWTDKDARRSARFSFRATLVIARAAKQSIAPHEERMIASLRAQ